MSGHSFVHQALVYEDVEGLLGPVIPFVRDGLERGDRVLAVTTRTNIDALSGALGDDAGRVDFQEAEQWYVSPSRTLRAYADYVATEGNGRSVRVIGEPVWPGSEAAVREWARYESIVNVALAGAPAWIVCPYDASALPAGILDFALRTHPELCAASGAVPSDEFLDPRAFSAALDEAGLPDPPPGAAERPLAQGPSRLRRFVAVKAAAAGVSLHRLGDLQLAVHEVLTNAVVHGRGRGCVRVWSEDGAVVCEVADDGPGLPDPLAGHLPPPEQPRGFGLWIARQLCDLVEVRSSEAGTRVRLSLRLDD
jgi:anti-sigma regulatory factor (Ser/Thr protein kinase)